MTETVECQTTPVSPSLRDVDVRRSLGTVDPSFYIIGVGASAGGLDAIKQLIAQAGDGFGHSFVIIQHISPDHKSLMTEILARETGLTVKEITDDMPLAARHIYLTPPRTNVVIQGTDQDTQPAITDGTVSVAPGLRFSLVSQRPRPQLNLPIDVFFASLAEAVGNRAIAIVLSGTGTDGSRGLRAVKDRDGFVMVQEPETAIFDGMPTAAIETNLVDLIAPPDAMVSEIRRYIDLRDDGLFDIEELFRESEPEFSDLVSRISRTASIDFTQYKKPTLRRRIARRVALNQCCSVADYARFVEDNPKELGILHREFLVGVTNFFRDLPAWMNLSRTVLAKLFSEGDPQEPVKVWSVGCSTGEEAYTIAMLLEKYCSDHGISREFRIFASDVNEVAIRAAKDGVYPESVIEEIPRDYRSEGYLSVHGGTFKIRNTIRNRIIFNTHNVLQEPPYINTDLVICRNLLIYFSPEMQKRVLSLFSFSLRDNGFLFLGAAETVTHQFSKFQTEDISSRIYSNKRPVESGHVRSADTVRSVNFPAPRMRRLATRETQRATSVALGPILEATLGDIKGCILILDEAGNILETMGHYRSFVHLPDQAFSANAFDLVHDRLKSTVSILTRRADTEGYAEALATKCAFEDRIELVDVFCRRVEWDAQPVAYSLMFRKSDVQRMPSAEDVNRTKTEQADLARVAKLEAEIESLQAMLTVTTEDLGVSNEELQAANEELTVSNEELQSNNEEMQSINEELHTVNAENADKIAQLETANADIENLLNVADFAIVFLDEQRCIRRFNPAIRRYIDLKPSDIGRQLASFASSLTEKDHARLLSELETAEEETEHQVRLRNGSSALLRIKPFYNAGKEQPDGLALTFLDQTEQSLAPTDAL
ncbi:MAG: chemotaxis protein CheB [Pseudomonadota bacterium]